MLLKIEGSDVELVAFIEAMLDLASCNITQAGTDAPGKEQPEQSDARPGDFMFWQRFYGLYLHPKNISIETCHALAMRATLEQYPGALIPTQEQVKIFMRPFDHDLICAVKDLAEEKLIEKLFPELWPQPEPQPEPQPKPAPPKKSKKADATPDFPLGGECPYEPKKRRKGGVKPIIITADEVKESGALECDTIPEAIEAIIVLCNCNKASIARLLEVDNAAISSAANGQVYPYVANAFKQYFNFPKQETDDEGEA